MSKYDWSNVPKEVKFIATDKDGVANGFTKEPKPCTEYEMWLTEDDDDDYVSLGVEYLDVFDKTVWEHSLEERPNE